jgi:amidase
MTVPLEYWSLLRLSEEIHSGGISSAEVTAAQLARIEKIDGIYQSYVTVMAERAMAQAAQADAEIAAGRWRGPLHGIPIALKDLCFTKAAPTTAGMSIHKDRVPDFDATVVERLDQAGAVTLGKLKMTEGAGGSHHPSVPAPRNPWNTDYWPGVSSSGSGVATAAGLCFGSLGSDTGGSIRFPSSACGITGIKPTWGRVSRHGIFTLADSLDHVGPMARSAADAAAILGVIAGSDPNDPTALNAPVPDYLAGLGVSIRGLRIGIDMAYAGQGSDPEILAALDDAVRVLAALGAAIKPVAFPSVDHLIGSWMPIVGLEIADAHRDTYPARAAEYGALAGMIDMGLNASPLAIAEAGRARRAFCGRVDALWSDIDLLLVPALPMTVPTATEMDVLNQDFAQMSRLVRFTIPFDLTGSPTISLPCGFSKNGLPLGVQLVGRHLSEPLLCQAGYAFQRLTDWHTRHPAI